MGNRKASTLGAMQIEDDQKLDIHLAADKHLREIETIKQNLLERGLTPPARFPPHDYYRFIRARKGNLKLAEEMLDNHVKWRAEKDIESVKVPPFARVMKESYPTGWAGVCKDGRPIYVEKLGALNIEKLLKVCPHISDAIDFFNGDQEQTRYLRYIATSMQTGKPCYDNMAILDLRGVSIRTVTNKNVREFVKLISQTSSAHFPESAGRILIIGAPFGFETAWKVIKAFIDPRTAAKIQIKKGVDEVHAWCDKSQLPVFLGGTIPDADVLDGEGKHCSWNQPAFKEKLKKEGNIALWEQFLRKYRADNGLPPMNTIDEAMSAPAGGAAAAAPGAKGQVPTTGGLRSSIQGLGRRVTQGFLGGKKDVTAVTVASSTAKEPPAAVSSKEATATSKPAEAANANNTEAEKAELAERQRAEEGKQEIAAAAEAGEHKAAEEAKIAAKKKAAEEQSKKLAAASAEKRAVEEKRKAAEKKAAADIQAEQETKIAPEKLERPMPIEPLSHLRTPKDAIILDDVEAKVPKRQPGILGWITCGGCSDR